MARRYFLRCVILSDILFFSLVAGQSPRYELRGQKVSLKPDIPGRPENILWKRNGNKVVEFNGQEQEAYGQYENRVSLDWHSAELEIVDLRFEDSGDYELEVYMNKKFSTSLHKLEVIDRVAKPTISCEMNDGGNSNKSGTLLCSAEPRQSQSLMTFEWRSHGIMQSGPNLKISLGDKYDDEVYSCTVSNPRSNDTASFTAKDCNPGGSLSAALIGSLAVILIILTIIIVIVGLCIFRYKHQQGFTEAYIDDPENQTQATGDKESNLPAKSTLTSTPQIGKAIGDDHASNHQEDTDLTLHALEKKGLVSARRKNFELNGGSLPSPTECQTVKNKYMHGKTPPASAHRKSSSHLDSNHVTNNNKESDKETVDDDEHMLLLQTTSTPSCSQPFGFGPGREKDEEGKSPPANVVTPVPKPRSQLPQNSPNIAPEGTTGGQKEDANSNQVNGETDTSGVGEANESGASGEDEQLSPVSEQKDSETTQHDQDPNLTQSETHTSEDNQQEMDKPVSATEKESGSEGNSEEPDLYSASSHQPQSSTPTKPDNRSNDTFQESPDAAHEEPVLFKNKDEHEEIGSSPSTPCSESPSPLDPYSLAINGKGDADADQLSETAVTEVPHQDPSDFEKENEQKTADV